MNIYWPKYPQFPYFFFLIQHHMKCYIISWNVCFSAGVIVVTLRSLQYSCIVVGWVLAIEKHGYATLPSYHRIMTIWHYLKYMLYVEHSYFILFLHLIKKIMVILSWIAINIFHVKHDLSLNAYYPTIRLSVAINFFFPYCCGDDIFIQIVNWKPHVLTSATVSL